MAEVRDQASGKVITIADDELGDYVLRGYQVRPGTLVPVMVQGELKGLAADEVAGVEELGGHIATGAQVAEVRKQREYGEGAGAVRGGAEALARGATAGLSDVAAAGLGADAEGLKERRQRGGDLTTGLEVAGTVAPLLLSGGSSLLARGAAAAGAPVRGIAGGGKLVGEAVTRAMGGPTSRLARMAGQGAAGLAEGSAFGAGMAASEAALEDSPLTAEQLLAHMGTGAVLGGATGGLLGGLSRGSRRGMAELVDDIPAGALTAGEAGAAGTGIQLADDAAAAAGAPGAAPRGWGSKGVDVGTWADEGAAGAAGGPSPAPGAAPMNLLGAGSPAAGAAGAAGAARAAGAAVPPGAKRFIQNVADEQINRFVKAFDAGELEGAGYESAFSAGRPMAKHLKDARRFNGPDYARKVGKIAFEDLPPRAGKPFEHMNQEDMHAASKIGVSDFGEMMGAATRKTDEAAQAAMRGDLLPNTDQIYASIRSEITDPLTSAEAGAGSRKIARELLREIDPYFKARQGRVTTFQDLKAFQKRFSDTVENKLGAQTESAKAFKEARRTMEREIEQRIEQANVELNLGTAYREAKEKYSAMKTIEKMSLDSITRDQKNRLFSLSDYLTGTSVMAGATALGAGPGALLLGLALGAVNKFARERGSFIAAGAFNRVSKTRGIQQAAAKAGDRMKEAVANAFDGAPRAASTVSSSRAPRSAKAAASGVSEGVAEVVRRAPAGAIMVSRAPKTAAERSETFAREVKEAQHLSQNPAAVAARVQEALGEDVAQVAPATSAAAVAAVIRGVEFLQSKSPRAELKASDILSGQADRQRVSDTEQAKFLRYVDAVKNPGEVIADFGNGTITPEAAEALRVVYPEMFASLEKEILTKLAEPGSTPSYERLTRMSRLLGRPLHPTHEPAFIATIQAMHAASRGKTETAGGAPSSTPAQMTGAEPTTAQRVSAGGN